MELISGGVCAAKGFFATGISAGIKKHGLDLMLIHSKKPCLASGVFTENVVKAAPVVVSQKRINKPIHAVIVNSGNANCCTGKSGFDACARESKALSKALGVKEDAILISSTGIIGKEFPTSKIEKAIPKLVRSLRDNGNNLAKKAIMTTDTFPKEIAVKIKLNGKEIKIGAMAKGAGMIHPNMATMLCFITTDAKIDRAALKSALKEAVDESFNSITVDGDTSTNDTVVILSNGLAGNDLIKIGSAGFKKFSEALKYVTLSLAKLIVKDGEGATKFVTIKVLGARNNDEARLIGRFIGSSNLLKCAIYGQDPNWGRIAAKAGSSAIKFDFNKLDIFLGNEKVLSKGNAFWVDKKILEKSFRKKDIDITVSMGSGKGKSTCFTCDLTEEYIKINAAYE